MSNHTTTRRVWAAVTLQPAASLREIAEAVGLKSATTALYHLRKLEDLGYVVKEPGRGRARRVVVPFAYR